MTDMDFSRLVALDEIIKTEYLQFNRCIMENNRGVTEYWEVYSTQNYALLGSISWFGRWRRYAFSPAVITWWDAKRLRTVSEFIEGRMKARRK